MILLKTTHEIKEYTYYIPKYFYYSIFPNLFIFFLIIFFDTKYYLVEDKTCSTGGKDDGTTISSITIVIIIFIVLFTRHRTTLIGDNLKVEIRWNPIIWIWNDR